MNAVVDEGGRAARQLGVESGPMPPEHSPNTGARLRRFSEWILYAAACAMALAFVAEALWRRLNFDEAMALKSGWLALEGQAAEPPFVMPVTLFLGQLGRLLNDSVLVFASARLLVALSVLGALAWVLHRSWGDFRKVAACVALSLAAKSLAVHGYEFRYDWGIVVGLLVAFGALVGRRGRRQSRRDGLLLGLALALCASHHLKGAAVAACVVLVAVARGWQTRSWRALAWAGTSAAAFLLLWLGLVVALGLQAQTFGLYSGFATLRAEWAAVGPSFSTLVAAVRSDLAWWLLALAATIAAVWGVARRRVTITPEDPRPWALAMAAVALLPLAAHPHPWPYMLAPAVPFLAFLMTEWLWACGRRRLGLALVIVVLVVTLQIVIDRSWPLGFHGRVAAAPRAPQTALLAALRELAEKGDRVVDPSGMAWFLRPCDRQWYVDTLFLPGIESGNWMADGGGLARTDCRWVVISYRFELLPPAWQAEIQRSSMLFGAALARRPPPQPGSPEYDEILRTLAPLRELKMESYW